MRVPCPLCGSVACMLLSPAFCRTTRRNRTAGTAPLMPASVIVRPYSTNFAPAVPVDPYAKYKTLGQVLALALSPEPELTPESISEPISEPMPERRPRGRTRGSNR